MAQRDFHVIILTEEVHKLTVKVCRKIEGAGSGEPNAKHILLYLRSKLDGIWHLAFVYSFILLAVEAFAFLKLRSGDR